MDERNQAADQPTKPGVMVQATARGEYGGIWYQRGDVFRIAGPEQRARWMVPADPKDPAWSRPVPVAPPVPAPDLVLVGRLQAIEEKLDQVLRLAGAGRASGDTDLAAGQD